MKPTLAPEEIAERPMQTAPHNDGIGEDDNAIPFWFNASFLATIIFAIVYVIYYVVMGWTSRGQCEADIAGGGGDRPRMLNANQPSVQMQPRRRCGDRGRAAGFHADLRRLSQARRLRARRPESRRSVLEVWPHGCGALPDGDGGSAGGHAGVGR